MARFGLPDSGKIRPENLGYLRAYDPAACGAWRASPFLVEPRSAQMALLLDQRQSELRYQTPMHYRQRATDHPLGA